MGIQSGDCKFKNAVTHRKKARILIQKYNAINVNLVYFSLWAHDLEG